MSDMLAYILAAILTFVVGGIIYAAIFLGGERTEK
jgi:hypothetical protein